MLVIALVPRQALHLHENLLFATRRAVGGGAQKAHRGRPPTPKTSEQRRFIAKAIMANENLRVAAMLDDARAQSMVELMWKEEVPEGKSIIVEGDVGYLVGSQLRRFFVCVSGG